MIKSSFKKLKVWEKAMALAKKIHQLTQSFPKEERYGLTSQMQRSAVSVPSNIAEGSQRVSDKEFSNFILIARGSLAELETQTILACDFNYLSKETTGALLIEIDELQKMLNGFYTTLTAKS